MENLSTLPGAEINTSGNGGSSTAPSGPSSLNPNPPGMPNTATGSSLSSTDLIVVVAIIGLVVFLWWKSREG